MAADSPKSCYSPNGSLRPNHTPCDQSSDDSHCCAADDYCLSNGHCLQAQGPYANRIGRGSCTDQTWRSTACPYECSDLAKDTDCTLFLAYDSLDGSFCCRGNFDTETQSCRFSSGNFGSTPFNMSAGRIIWNRTDGSVMENGTLLPSQVQLSQAETTITLQPSSSNSTDLDSNPESSSSNVLPIAAGIAVPLGVLLLVSLVAIAFLTLKLMRLKRELHKSGQSLDSDNGASGDHPMSMQHVNNSADSRKSHAAVSSMYQPLQQYGHDQVNEAPVENAVVEAAALTPVVELGSGR